MLSGSFFTEGCNGLLFVNAIRSILVFAVVVDILVVDVALAKRGSGSTNTKPSLVKMHRTSFLYHAIEREGEFEIVKLTRKSGEVFCSLASFVSLTLRSYLKMVSLSIYPQL